MNRSERFMQRNRKVAGARRGEKDSAFGPEYAAFRKDAGWKMTDEVYGKYKEEESEFNKAYDKAGSALDKAYSENSKGQAEVDKYGEALAGTNFEGTSLEGAWKDYKKGFVNVRIVGKDDKIESTHYLPKEAVDAMSKDLNKIYWGNYVGNNNYNISTKTRGGGGYRGKELRSSIVSGEEAVKAKFYGANAGNVKKANSEGQSAYNSAYGTASNDLNTANANLASGRADIDSQRSELNKTKQGRKEQIAKYANDYSTALQGRRNLMKSGSK